MVGDRLERIIETGGEEADLARKLQNELDRLVLDLTSLKKE